MSIYSRFFKELNLWWFKTLMFSFNVTANIIFVNDDWFP